MTEILLVGPQGGFGADFERAMDGQDARISRAESCGEALEKIRREKFDLIVADERVAEMTGTECIRKLIAADPMSNCAAASALSPEEFHEATEGLGILMQLPRAPKKEDARKLLDHWRHIMDLTKRTAK